MPASQAQPLMVPLLTPSILPLISTGSGSGSGSGGNQPIDQACIGMSNMQTASNLLLFFIIISGFTPPLRLRGHKCAKDSGTLLAKSSPIRCTRVFHCRDSIN